MNDNAKSREQLLEELQTVRRQLADLKEAALIEANHTLQALIEASPFAIVFSDVEERVMLWNPAATQLFGWTEEEILGHPLPTIPADARDEAVSIRKTVFSGGVMAGCEARPLRKDGSRAEVTISAAPVKDAGGQPYGIVTMYADMAERKATERALRESEEIYRTLVETIDDAITVKDRDGRYLMVNSEFTRRTGLPKEELVGKMPADIHGDILGSEPRANDLRVLQSGVPVDMIEEYPLRDAAQVCHVRKVPWRSATGEIVGVVGVSRDITGRRQLEEQLIRAQKLELAGRMAGQVAHDFNNLLGPLALYPDLIKSLLPEGHQAVRYCDTMLQAVQQMAEINSDMLALARRSHTQRERADLNALVHQAVEQTGALPRGLAVELDLAVDLHTVMASPAQVIRILVNLISNAREAVGDTGRISVKTENVLTVPSIGTSGQSPLRRYVRISVSDTGPGIPFEMRERIFEPFFTTKTSTARRGSGLGLAIVQAIVADHQGHVAIDSEVGRGTVFSVYLPATEEPLKAQQLPLLEGGQEAVLVVDDDPLQRDVLKTALTKLGYGVETVASGEAALSHLEAHTVDLLLLDMVMPGGIDGAETYRRAKSMRPNQKALIMSGFADTERVTQALDLSGKRFLAKPIRLDELARAVRDELNRKS